MPDSAIKQRIPAEVYQLEHWSGQWLAEQGFNESTQIWFILALDVLIIALAAWMADFLARKILLRIIGSLVKRSEVTWDDILFKKRVFNTLAHIAPAMVVRWLAPAFFSDFAWVARIILPVTSLYILFLWLFFGIRVLNALREFAKSVEKLKDKPIDSYIQLMKVIVYIVGVLYLLSLLLNKSPLTILGAFGALTAVLILVFKDVILGFVASITISVNDLVRIGDWVSFDKYGADGDVMEITLTTVKVRNFDNTVTTVPTYAFVSDAFKNWRSMQDSGVRRIKRSLFISSHSVRLCTLEMIDRYGRIQLIQEFLMQRLTEIEQYNLEQKADKSLLINGRNLTNIGLFRVYAEAYLRSKSQISKEHTCMVRQLQSGANGVPLEVYCFSTEIQWVRYETLQSDIFDHLMAACEYFDLEIFEDIRSIKSH